MNGENSARVRRARFHLEKSESKVYQRMSFASDSTCIFCKIVAGSEPASKFYEDNEILGFMNHKPVHPGECLLIPKEHIDHFMDINDELAARIIKLRTMSLSKNS